jgi:hypothetical protein
MRVAGPWWRGDPDGQPACCHPGHHRDPVRIAVDGAIGPEDDRRALGPDVGDGRHDSGSSRVGSGACGARAVAPAGSPSAEHVLRNGRSRPLRRPGPFPRAERVRFCKPKLTYTRKQVNYDPTFLGTSSAAAMVTCYPAERGRIIACELIYSRTCSAISLLRLRRAMRLLAHVICCTLNNSAGQLRCSFQRRRATACPLE